MPAAEEKPGGSPMVDRTGAGDSKRGDWKEKQAEVKGAAPCAKHGLEGEQGKMDGSSSSSRKRPKLAEPEAIVISD